LVGIAARVLVICTQGLGGVASMAYKIVSISSGLVLDVPLAAAGPANIRQYADEGGLNQQWRVVPVDGSDALQIVSASSGLVLHVPYAATGSVDIQQYPDSGGNNQHWQLVPVQEDIMNLPAIAARSRPLQA
jgi:hypothetical protein